MMTVILSGLPFCGKSFYASKVAEVLEIDHVDTDRLIEAEYFKMHAKALTCREIHRQNGEAFFRQLEETVVLSLQASNVRRIISIGGGTLLSKTNVQHLRSIGTLIYLETPFIDLLTRLNKIPVKPSYLDESKDTSEAFYAICQARLPHYEQASHHTLKTLGLSSQQIVEEIIKFLVGHNSGI